MPRCAAAKGGRGHGGLEGVGLQRWQQSLPVAVAIVVGAYTGQEQTSPAATRGSRSVQGPSLLSAHPNRRVCTAHLRYRNTRRHTATLCPQETWARGTFFFPGTSLTSSAGGLQWDSGVYVSRGHTPSPAFGNASDSGLSDSPSLIDVSAIPSQSVARAH